MRTLCLTLIGLLAAAPCSAETVACTVSSAHYHWPAQSLSRALQAFTARTHCAVLIDPPLVQGKMTPSIDGTYEPRDALRRLIDGNNLEFVHGQDGFLVHPNSYDLAQHNPLTN